MINLWFRIERLGIWILRLLLNIWVRLKWVPHEPSDIQLDVTKPICYILPSNSVADALALDQACLANHLPRPLLPMNSSQLDEKRALVSLRRPDEKIRSAFSFKALRQRHTDAEPLPPDTSIPFESPRLRRLIEFTRDNPENDVQIVPITIFWGRSPDKKNKEKPSFLKMLFSDTWTVPSVLRKIVMIILHGRSTLIQFSPPISLQQLVQDDLSEDRHLKKLLRLLRVHFRRQREMVVGPDLSHRRTMVNRILDGRDVKNAIANRVRNEDVAYRRAAHQARNYANEIAADYSYAVISSLDVALNWLWNRIYSGVQVYHIENIKQVADTHEIVYVPCHRSHIDYLLLSFVVYQHGLVPPHIAAGINLNMPIIGPMLRRGGAFFMRRSFKGNELYAAVFNEYLHLILKQGFSIEYFVEGGRSRTGRLMPPRKGMLSMTATSYLRDARRPIAFIPVYIGYEKLFEGKSYVNELYGKKKNKETIWATLGNLRKLNENFGKVHVNFGNPIILDHIFDQFNAKWREQTTLPTRDANWFDDAVSTLANKIVTGINASAVTNPISLISLALLATPKHTMDERALMNQIDLYRTLLQNCPYSNNVVLSQFNGKEAIEHAEAMNVLQRRRHPLGDLLYLSPEHAVLLTYFRNNIIHQFVLPSLIASFCQHNFAVSKERIIAFINAIYPFLKAELFLRWEKDEVADMTSHWIETLRACDLLVNTEHDIPLLRIPNFTSPNHAKLVTLGGIIEQSLERHFITLALLLKHDSGNVTKEELEEQCCLMAQRLSFLFEFSAPEFFDKVLFRNFIDTLLQQQLIQENSTGSIVFDKTLEIIFEEMRLILSSDVRQAIRQVTHDIA